MVMETYADILRNRKEQKMSNYDMDEIERQRERERRSRGIKSEDVKLGKDETPYTAVDIELPDDEFMRIAREAHERDITFNKMVNIILKDGIDQAEYRFEHANKPVLLSEDK